MWALMMAFVQKPVSSLEYDKLARLTEAQGVYGKLAYRYDGVGNRLEKRTQTAGTSVLQHAEPTKASTETVEHYRYAQDSNRLLAVGSRSEDDRQLNYDEVGNIIQDANRDANKALRYAANNRLERVETPNGYVEYVYNAKGQRVIRKRALYSI